MLWTLKSFWHLREFLGSSEEGGTAKCLTQARYTFLCTFSTTPLALITVLIHREDAYIHVCSPEVSHKLFPLPSPSHVNTTCSKCLLLPQPLVTPWSLFYHLPQFLCHCLINSLFHKSARSSRLETGTMSLQLTVVSPGSLYHLIFYWYLVI